MSLVYQLYLNMVNTILQVYFFIQYLDSATYANLRRSKAEILTCRLLDITRDYSTLRYQNTGPYEGEFHFLSSSPRIHQS